MLQLHISSTGNTSDLSHHMYHAQKQDANVEYLGRYKMVLSIFVGSINFVDPAKIREAHEKLMNQVRTKATHISNKCKFQIEPIQVQGTRFLPNLEMDFPKILNEVLGQNIQRQQQLPNSNEKRSILKDRRTIGTNTMQE